MYREEGWFYIDYPEQTRGLDTISRNIREVKNPANSLISFYADQRVPNIPAFQRVRAPHRLR